jgi:hypothetical protein
MPGTYALRGAPGVTRRALPGIHGTSPPRRVVNVVNFGGEPVYKIRMGHFLKINCSTGVSVDRLRPPVTRHAVVVYREGAKDLDARSGIVAICCRAPHRDGAGFRTQCATSGPSGQAQRILAYLSATPRPSASAARPVPVQRQGRRAARPPEVAGESRPKRGKAAGDDTNRISGSG